MIYIADYFAIGLVIIMFIFFWDTKTKYQNMPVSGKIFGVILMMTALNALVDLLSGWLLTASGVPEWLNITVNSLYFVTNVVTTSAIARYLFVRILEHTHHRHCMRNASIALASILGVYLLIVIVNLWTGILFYFDENGNYIRGPLNAIGYFFTLLQMVFVLICYFRNKKTANKLMRRVLINIFPVVPVCILIQRMFPEIMMNSILIAFADVVIFMTFMSQRPGVHSLTELNDRYRFFEHVDHMISKQEPFHIFLINLKNFGSVNKKYGHVIGDESLYQFAFSLERKLWEGLSFHMNGTTFAVVLPYVSQNEEERHCGVLLDYIEQGICFGEYHIDVDYLVSHYISDGSEMTATDIYEIMEHSMAKCSSMNLRYIRCDREIRVELERKRYLRDRLSTIDTAHGFEVWYQPIKCLGTGRFCSMEALIRLREPNGKLISPAEFIPIAEQTGQIRSISWFVLDEVCQLLKREPEMAQVSVSINLPMTQLLDKGFIPRFLGVVDQAGVDRRQICIEFTERTILENFSQTQSIMNELNDAGIRFYLDDFGVGYSNFNCLLQLPFQMIKIDASFIRNQDENGRNLSTVRVLTKIFHDMNLTVVAEGAETQDEVDTLSDIGVDRIQGYVFARPMPRKELLSFYGDQKQT